MRGEDARNLIAELARRYGFGPPRFARVESSPGVDRYDAWLAAGHHGSMDYLVRGRDDRADPRRRLPSARSAAILHLVHHHRPPPDPGGRTGQVARYAWGRDYHNLVGKRLRKLQRELRSQGLRCWGGVDTAPILERGWADLAGVGFAGHNCAQIRPASTSWFFLAVVFIDAEVEPDPPLARRCGRCRRCLDACPTGALVAEGTLDARRCVAYWTIEARGLPPHALRARFGRRLFGCDTCQAVCPHNRTPPQPQEDDLLPRHAWLDLDELIHTEDAQLIERFRGTPLRRPGAIGLKRNALLVLANVGDPDGVPAARAALVHPSPVVRGAAVWALGTLGDHHVHDHQDDHPLVGAELQRWRRPGAG